MSVTQSTSYQEGSIALVKRRKGPDVWVFRWRVIDNTGKRVQRKRIIGNQQQYPKLRDAKRAVEPYRILINKPLSPKPMTFGDLWLHFEKRELHSVAIDRSPTTKDMYYVNMGAHLLPMWGALPLTSIKTVAVEEWLIGLDLADGTKNKLRNQLSCLFRHAKRHELYSGENPITLVRQGGIRRSIPELLSLEEIQAILARLEDPVHHTLVLVAAVTALRRSEIRGLKWRDVDFDNRWLSLRRGVVRKHTTKLKTEGSRKGIPIPPELSYVLLALRERSLYRGDDDWVFASATTGGRSPLWMDPVLNLYVRPAAREAGIVKTIGWHTFRRSLASILGDRGEPVLVVKELLRHAQASTTQDIYQQASQKAKRLAQQHTSELFLLTEKAG